MKILLKFLSFLYGFLAFLRRYLYEHNILKKKKLPLPVISIGNLSVGGTGKTPLTIFTAKQLQKLGLKPCVLSRGYKRKTNDTIVVSDGEKIFVSWEYAGDEPYIMAKRGIPVVVSSERYKAGFLALEKIKPDLFILDDGFQHFQLERDINILIVDSTNPFWKDYLLPLGRLREPKSFYQYADFFVITKLFNLTQEQKEKFFKEIKKFDKPFFIAKEKLSGVIDKDYNKFDFSILEKKEIVVFAGLGNNKQFFDTVKRLSKDYNFKIKEFISFPDHFDYKNIDLPKADIYLTTEKDIIKIDKKNVFAVLYDFELADKYIHKILERVKCVPMSS